MPVEIVTREDLDRFEVKLLKKIESVIDEKVMPRLKTPKVPIQEAAEEFGMTVKTFKTTGIPWYSHDDNPRKAYVYRKDLDEYEARRILARQNLKPKLNHHSRP